MAERLMALVLKVQQELYELKSKVLPMFDIGFLLLGCLFDGKNVTSIAAVFTGRVCIPLLRAEVAHRGVSIKF